MNDERLPSPRFEYAEVTETPQAYDQVLLCCSSFFSLFYSSSNPVLLIERLMLSQGCYKLDSSCSVFLNFEEELGYT